MPLRVIEALVPDSNHGYSLGLEELDGVVEVWSHKLTDERTAVRILTRPDHTERILDRLQSRVGHLDGFRLIVLDAEATVPTPPEIDPDLSSQPGHKRTGISRQELLAAMSSATRLDRRFLIMVVLSVVIASIGLLGSNVAVIIAAMVIAPLLGPNMALALATVTGDTDLGHRALRVNLAGCGIALGLAIGLGASVPDHLLESVEITQRTQAHWMDFPLALAAGTAGALSFAAGGASTLIGVMVAVALMPPLIVVGLMLGAAQWSAAGSTALLLAANLLSINLSGVATFWLEGIRPGRWWEADAARRATRRAVILSAALLATLVVVVLLTHR
jgi:uncharacterized hydrophobic protein (TIGR00341 family)